MGISVIDAGHFCTENIFCDFMVKALKERFPEIDAVTAESNYDIVEII